MIKSKKKLPNKLSDLMVLALKDLAKCERNRSKFIVDMGEWYKANGHCTVCFAGAVMAQSCGVPATKARSQEGVWPTEFSDANANKMFALNSIRQGCVHSALSDLGKLGTSKLPRTINVTPYRSSPKEWRKDMGRIVKLLRKHGE